MKNRRRPLVVIRFADGWFTIELSGLPHLLLREQVVAVQSWIQGNNERFFIEYLLANGTFVSTDYTERALWESILRELPFGAIDQGGSPK